MPGQNLTIQTQISRNYIISDVIPIDFKDYLMITDVIVIDIVSPPDIPDKPLQGHDRLTLPVAELPALQKIGKYVSNKRGDHDHCYSNQNRNQNYLKKGKPGSAFHMKIRLILCWQHFFLGLSDHNVPIY